LRVLVGITLPVASVLGAGIGPLLGLAFDFGPQGTQMLLWVTRGFLLGLAGHSMLEIAARSFYARQDALTPLKTAALNLVVYIALGSVLFRVFGAPGISLTDSLAFTSQALLLLFLLNRRLEERLTAGSTVLRALLAAGLGVLVVMGVMFIPLAARQPVLMTVVALGLGGLLALLPVWKEVRLLLKL